MAFDQTGEELPYSATGAQSSLWHRNQPANNGISLKENDLVQTTANDTIARLHSGGTISSCISLCLVVLAIHQSFNEHLHQFDEEEAMPRTRFPTVDDAALVHEDLALRPQPWEDQMS